MAHSLNQENVFYEHSMHMMSAAGIVDGETDESPEVLDPVVRISSESYGAPTPLRVRIECQRLGPSWPLIASFFLLGTEG